jgi:hypothetical protein
MGMRSVAVMTSSVPAVVWPGNAIRLLKEDHAIEDKRSYGVQLVVVSALNPKLKCGDAHVGLGITQSRVWVRVLGKMSRGAMMPTS